MCITTEYYKRNGDILGISIYKVVIYFVVFLSVCLDSDHNFTYLLQNLIGELGRTTGMFLVRFKNSKLSKFTFIEKTTDELGSQARS